MYLRPESNRHVLRHTILSRARLPIPPLRQLPIPPCLRQAGTQADTALLFFRLGASLPTAGAGLPAIFLKNTLAIGLQICSNFEFLTIYSSIYFSRENACVRSENKVFTRPQTLPKRADFL